MANNIYEEIIFQINNLLKQEKIYPKYMQAIESGKNDFKISQVYTRKNYDDSWIDFIEDCLVPLDNIVRNPRKFIVIEEDIVDVSLARSISVESVKHLAQHTNLIASVDKKGTVIPSKILNTSKEESYEVYENRFIYTLLLKTRDFINRRFDLIKGALMKSGEIGVDVSSQYSLDGAKVDCKIDTSANFPFDAAFKKKGDQQSDVERITRINSIFSDFLASPFAREMRTCALVRPPITRTNVILKNPDFKKALLLWQFVESNEKLDYQIDTTTEVQELNPALTDRYRGLVFLNTVLLQSIASIRKDDGSLDKSEKDEKTQADEYVTKNIDDYVPDDFPQLKMDLNEVRRIYYRIPGQKTLNLTEIAKINAALDRVMRQYRINKAREDSITQQRLIAEQLQEEAEAKKLALREARDLERKKKQEEARYRLEQRKAEIERKAQLKRAEEERIEAERLAELERIRQEEERIAREAQLKREEEERRLLEEQKAKEEAMRLRIEEEHKAAIRLQKELEAYRARLEQEAIRAEKELRERQELYWKKQRELAVRLQQTKDNEEISGIERDILERMLADEKAQSAALKRITSSLRAGIIVEHYKEIDALYSKAKEFRSEEDIAKIKVAVEKGDKRDEKKKARKQQFDTFVEGSKVLFSRIGDAIKASNEKAKVRREEKKKNKKGKFDAFDEE
ncbi:MAG: hypothetical protein IKM01_03140 [Clostridia bacterium]|nr:hypothetical protein [Clostridia bacterium]